MASLAPASTRTASLDARGPSTVNAAPGSAMKVASIARLGLNSCTHDTRAYGDNAIPLLKANRVSNCAPKNVGSEDTLIEPKLRPSGPAAPAGTGFVSVKPFCPRSPNCTATNGVTANQLNACFAPTSKPPPKRLLPKLPVAVSVGPMPTTLRVSLLRNVLKLSVPAA